MFKIKKKNRPVFLKCIQISYFFKPDFPLFLQETLSPALPKMSGSTTVNSFFFCRSDTEKQRLKSGLRRYKIQRTLPLWYRRK